MSDLIRDAPIGQFIRFITNNRLLQYPEERPDFECPTVYADPDKDFEAKIFLSLTSASSPSQEKTADLKKDFEDAEKVGVEPAEAPPAEERLTSSGLRRFDLERVETSQTGVRGDLEKAISSRELSRIGTREALSHAHTQVELQQAFSEAAAASLFEQSSRTIVPQRTSDGIILVDWYTTDDPDNPQNWSFGKKMFASTLIYLYTLAVYMGSAIYTPSAEGVMKEFDVSTEAASLGLSLYVLAYGIGPLIFSPLSEIPVVGRNPPYMTTMAIFVVLCVPTALVENFAGLLVLRFLQGFFGSPCLATGGASLQDMYSLIKLPYVLCLWAFAATCGPAMGPIISGFSVAAENWRWSLWEMLWLSGPVFLMMFMFLPETSSSNILLRRAQRLRKVTGNHRLKAQSEIDQASMRPNDVAFEALVRPIQLIVQDPAIGFTAVYVALCYGIYYSFFEAFPLVYIAEYGFNVGEMGLTFLSITVGVVLAIIVYYAYIYYVVEPDIMKNGLGLPERRLIPALIASFFLPAGLFLFGWTGNGHVPWIVSVIGIMIFTTGVFALIQCIFVYLPLVYPQYAASLFAGNDFARSLLACAAIMFSRPMYLGMGIGPGTSLLGALTAACIGGIFVLYFFGAKLRSRSKFSAK
ncbi:hypothetical protein M433DRAFT_146212 [Acidomyces richmondensis BFW]|nr:MAG: hypothetical protein FE78DRAFT_256374 [Acidomyces sp. 'richmondensis']KYG43066.1 hypothetical protein M433DRAFT_146212 [Acidomyces richmondensis BFW]